MALTFAAIGNPAQYAGTLRERPRWVGRFILLAVFYIGLGVYGSVSRAGLAADRLPPSASAEDRLVATELLLDGSVMRSMFLPVRLFTGWAAFALVLLYACRIWSMREEVRFVHIFAAEVHAEGVIFLGNAASLAVVILGGDGSDPAIPWIPAGLDMVIPAEDFTARYLLNSVNFFSIAYAALLVLTVSVMLSISRIKAFISVLIAWGSTIFVNAGIFHALRTEFHLGI